MALLSWRQPHCEAKGWREASYLSTMRSRCRFFCLSWLFLTVCNLRLVWLLSSWALRDPVGTERHNHWLGSVRSGQALWPLVGSPIICSNRSILRAAV